MSQRRRPSGQPNSPRHAGSGGSPQGQRRSARGNQKPRPRPAPRRPSAADFWGGAPGPEADGDGGGGREGALLRIDPTPDPGALPRSLGDPPLGPNPAAAQAQLAAVYEEAVRAATALAAANGLLATEDG